MPAAKLIVCFFGVVPFRLIPFRQKSFHSVYVCMCVYVRGGKIFVNEYLIRTTTVQTERQYNVVYRQLIANNEKQ